jgi:hypothetical protein
VALQVAYGQAHGAANFFVRIVRRSPQDGQDGWILEEHHRPRRVEPEVALARTPRQNAAALHFPCGLFILGA